MSDKGFEVCLTNPVVNLRDGSAVITVERHWLEKGKDYLLSCDPIHLTPNQVQKLIADLAGEEPIPGLDRETPVDTDEWDIL